MSLPLQIFCETSLSCYKYFWDISLPWQIISRHLSLPLKIFFETSFSRCKYLKHLSCCKHFFRHRSPVANIFETSPSPRCKSLINFQSTSQCCRQALLERLLIWLISFHVRILRYSFESSSQINVLNIFIDILILSELPYDVSKILFKKKLPPPSQKKIIT